MTLYLGLFVTLFSFATLISQTDSNNNRINSFLDFIPSNNSAIGIVEGERYKDTISSEWHHSNQIKIWSLTDGELISSIALNQSEYIEGFNVSHDGKGFVLQSKIRMFSKTDIFGKKEIAEIKYFSFEEKKWLWKKNWELDTHCMRLTFSEDNSQIICITNKNVLFIDTKTGIEIKKSEQLGSFLNEGDTEYSRRALSKYGNYFVFWYNYIYTSDWDDNSFVLSPLNPLTWPFRLIGAFVNLFDGPKYLYIWDVLNDNLKEKIEIPKGLPIGSPAFSTMGDTLYWGPIKNDYKLKIYDVVNSILIKESTDSLVFDFGEYKTISPDQKYLFETYRIVEVQTGKIIKKFDFKPNSLRFGSTYPAAFSSDKKYFITEEKGKICLYSTKGWEKIWEVPTE